MEKLSREPRNKDRSHSDTRVFRYLARDILFSALSTPFYIHLHIRGHSAGGRPCRLIILFGRPCIFFLQPPRPNLIGGGLFFRLVSTL